MLLTAAVLLLLGAGSPDAGAASSPYVDFGRYDTYDALSAAEQDGVVVGGFPGGPGEVSLATTSYSCVRWLRFLQRRRLLLGLDDLAGLRDCYPLRYAGTLLGGGDAGRDRFTLFAEQMGVSPLVRVVSVVTLDSYRHGENLGGREWTLGT